MEQQPQGEGHWLLQYWAMQARREADEALLGLVVHAVLEGDHLQLQLQNYVGGVLDAERCPQETPLVFDRGKQGAQWTSAVRG